MSYGDYNGGGRDYNGGGGRGGGGYDRGGDRYGDRDSYRGGSGGGGGYGGGRGGYGGGRGGYGGGGGGGGRDRYGGDFNQLNTNINWAEVLPTLPNFVKDFYIEHPDVTARDEASAEQWRRENKIHIRGDGIPKPVFTFVEASMPTYVQDQVLKQGFDKPTPIQSQGWPMALKGRDMIGISATGSGKTLAFLLPAMIHINAQPYLEKGDGPICLVLAPTRELAMQIQTECDKFGASSDIKNCAVYGGGQNRRGQIENLRRTPEILIATPGRLLDFVRDGTTNLRRVTYLVCDEADRMLDMGFSEQLRTIVAQIRPDRQTLMWSATWPQEVQQISREFQKDAYEVHVGSMELEANKDITQRIHVMSDGEKWPKLMEEMKEIGDHRILIFVETKRGADQLTSSLYGQRFNCKAIHGDKSQHERSATLDEFRRGRVNILVATDVAARGLDIKNVNHVINFDMPKTAEDYVHRIGRCGRAGAKGTAISFATQATSGIARDVVKLMRAAGQTVPRELEDLASSRGGGGYGGRGGRGYGGRGGGRRY